MTNIFKKLESEQESEQLLSQCVEMLFIQGGVDPTVLEILGHIKVRHAELFAKYEQQILIRLGLFFKHPTSDSFEDNIFEIYHEHIKTEFDNDFTPIQADIINKIKANRVVSFSSPTSTGKSFIFRYLLTMFDKDIVIVVPSRALINEYYKRVKEIIDDKKVNVMTFVDKINTKRATRNIFIITPERTKDLFNLRNDFHIDLMLFDEAQLSEDKGVRGMYYDSVIRRAVQYFSDSKFIFAYPFVDNPEAQFNKNKIQINERIAEKYRHRNVGQIFYCFETDKKDTTKNAFFSFGVEQEIFGNKTRSEDPLEKVLSGGGSALIYCAKSRIYDKTIFSKFAKYYVYCKPIEAMEALDIINQIRMYIGASNQDNAEDYSSFMIRAMKRGVVLHHGSLPLRARVLIEEFVQKGFCRICFATATLEQGINMPFDLVWIERWLPSRRLDMKNLIGRAGRSSSEAKFDLGKIVIKSQSMGEMRALIKQGVSINTKSQLDNMTDPNDDYREYKEAIKNGTFSEEYNLSQNELNRINGEETSKLIESVLLQTFKNDKVNFSVNDGDENSKGVVQELFIKIYRIYLNRDLVEAEKDILNTTVKILFWRVEGQRFNQIVQTRYSFSAQTARRREMKKGMSAELYAQEVQMMRAGWLTKFDIIPNKNLISLNLNYNRRVSDVDYDLVVVDTYDYIDKLIGFRVGDVYFASFDKYAKNEANDQQLRVKAERVTNYIKYGTDNAKEIWLLRYGFEFEDFEWLIPIIENITEEEITFSDISNLSQEHKVRIERFI